MIMRWISLVPSKMVKLSGVCSSDQHPCSRSSSSTWHLIDGHRWSSSITFPALTEQRRNRVDKFAPCAPG